MSKYLGCRRKRTRALTWLNTWKIGRLQERKLSMKIASHWQSTKMSSTITIPTSVTCMENVKIASLGQNHFFRSVLNSHLLLQLIYFKLFYFCHIWFKFVFTHNPLWVWSFSQIINFEFTDTVKSKNNNILYYMEASIFLVRSNGTLKPDFLPLFTTWRSHHHFLLEIQLSFCDSFHYILDSLAYSFPAFSSSTLWSSQAFLPFR